MFLDDYDNENDEAEDQRRPGSDNIHNYCEEMCHREVERRINESKFHKNLESHKFSLARLPKKIVVFCKPFDKEVIYNF